MNHYFITGFPRSRTAWLANLLTWGDSFCFHEAYDHVMEGESIADVLGKVPHTVEFCGDSDSAIALCADDVLAEFPDAKFVFIKRPIEEVIESYKKSLDEDPLFVTFSREEIAQQMGDHERRLDDLQSQISSSRKMTVRYSDLERKPTVMAIWRFCLPGREFPHMRYAMLQNLRVTQIYGKVAASTPIGRKLNETVLAR